MYHIFFIHSSDNGHLGCFRDLAIVNHAAMNIEVFYAFFDHFNLLIFTQIMEKKGKKKVRFEDNVLAMVLETILQASFEACYKHSLYYLPVHLSSLSIEFFFLSVLQ